MKKVLELLENYVQYIAVAIGVLFVAAMAWLYLLKTPSVEIAGETLGAGQVDPKIAEGPANALEARVNEQKRVTIPLKVFHEEVPTKIKSGPTTKPLKPGWSTATPLAIDVPAAGTAGNTTMPTPTIAPPVINPGDRQRVQKMDPLPMAKPIGVTSGLSTVNLATMLAARDAAVQPMPGAVQPGMMQPGMEGQPAIPAMPAAAVRGADRNWVTAAYEIPMDQLANAVGSALVPQGLTTEFLRVEIEREEKDASGNWGGTTLVRPLMGSQLAQHPMPVAGNVGAEMGYRDWAAQNQVEILQPGFYAVLGGSPWQVPVAGGQAAAPAMGGAPFDPTPFLTGKIPDTLTEEQKKLVIKARQEEQKRKDEAARQERKNRAGNRPPPGGGRGGMPGGGFPPGGGPPGGGGPGGGGAPFMPPPPPDTMISSPMGSPMGDGDDAFVGAGALLSGSMSSSGGWTLQPASFVNVLQQGFGTRPPGYPPNLPWPPPGAGPVIPRGMPEMPPDYNPGFDLPQAGPTAPNMGSVPPGPFDPLVWQQGNIIAFAHDENVVAEKTYRYRMRYLILNPIYQQPAAASKPELAQQFAWASNWSEWSVETQIAPKVNFFVATKITNNASAVQFEVFTFVNGQRKSKTFAVTPGDSIGINDPAGDFSTGYVLVDIRKDSRENYALLMAPDGSLIKRDHTGDTSSSRYNDLKKQLSAAVGSTGH